MRALALLLPLLPACVITTHVEPVDASFDGPITRVVVDVDHGAVSVRGSDCDALAGTTCGTVSAELGWTGDRPRLTTEVIDGVLEVRGRCEPQLRCWVDVVVDAPPEASARVRTGSGGLDVTDLSGDLDLSSGSGSIAVRGGGTVVAEAGSGSIDVDGATGDLDLETGSGAIDARHLTGSTAWLETGSGSVDVAYDAAPADLGVDTGSGSVDVAVPAGAYDLSLHTGSGGVDVRGVDDRPGAPHRITVDTGSGSITIVGR